MSKVPEDVVKAINLLLAPYGEEYKPESGIDHYAKLGYKSTKDAAAFLGISRSMLYKLVQLGKIAPPVKLNKDAPNGKVVYPVADLLRYIGRA